MLSLPLCSFSTVVAAWATMGEPRFEGLSGSGYKSCASVRGSPHRRSWRTLLAYIGHTWGVWSVVRVVLLSRP